MVCFLQVFRLYCFVVKTIMTRMIIRIVRNFEWGRIWMEESIYIVSQTFFAQDITH